MYGALMVPSPFRDHLGFVSGRCPSIFLMNIGGCLLFTNAVLGGAYIFLLQALFLCANNCCSVLQKHFSFLLPPVRVNGGAESVS
jgi:hypothetical protein